MNNRNSNSNSYYYPKPVIEQDGIVRVVPQDHYGIPEYQIPRGEGHLTWDKEAEENFRLSCRQSVTWAVRPLHVYSIHESKYRRSPFADVEVQHPTREGILEIRIAELWHLYDDASRSMLATWAAPGVYQTPWSRGDTFYYPLEEDSEISIEYSPLQRVFKIYLTPVTSGGRLKILEIKIFPRMRYIRGPRKEVPVYR